MRFQATVFLALFVLFLTVFGALAHPAPEAAAPFIDPTALYGYIGGERLTFGDGEYQYITELTTTPSGSQLYLIAHGNVYLVDPQQAELVAQTSDLDWQASSLSLGPDGNRLLVYPAFDTTMPAVILDAGTLQTVDAFSIPGLEAGDVVMGASHLYVTPYISGSGVIQPHTAVYVADIQTGTVVTTVENTEPASHYTLALHDTALYLGNGSYYGTGNTITRYDISNGVPVQTAIVDAGFVRHMVASSDGAWLAVLDSQSQELKLFSTAHLSEASSRPYHTDAASPQIELAYESLAFSPDNSYLYANYQQAFGSNDYFVDVLEVETLETVLTFATGGYYAYAPHLAVFSDGDVAVGHNSGYGDSYLQFYRPATTQATLPVVNKLYCEAPLKDSFDLNDGRWPVVDRDSLAYYYDGGEYVIEHRSAGQWAAVTADDVWEGAKELQVTGRTASGTALYGLVFGLNDDWSEFFTFEIAPSYQVWLAMYYSDATGWIEIASGQSAAVVADGSNRLRVWGGDGSNRVSLLVNNTHVAGPFDIPPGRVGLSAASLGESSAEVRFDNYLFVSAYCSRPATRPLVQEAAPRSAQSGTPGSQLPPRPLPAILSGE